MQPSRRAHPFATRRLAALAGSLALLEQGGVTQAISGPFDLARPKGCRVDASSGGTRLNPKAPGKAHQKAHKDKKHSNKR